MKTCSHEWLLLPWGHVCAVGTNNKVIPMEHALEGWGGNTLSLGEAMLIGLTALPAATGSHPAIAKLCCCH